MPFERILSDLVGEVDGAIGAMFLDWEGESVGLVGSPEKHDMKLMGAYQGIFLSQLNRMAEEVSLGEVVFFKLVFRDAEFFNAALADGYYLSLATEPGVIEGIAWHRIERARRLLNNEIV